MPRRVLPLAKSNLKSPLETIIVSGLTQKLSCVVNAPKLEVPVPVLGVISRFGTLPHRASFRLGGGLFTVVRLPVKVMVSARVTVAAPRVLST